MERSNRVYQRGRGPAGNYMFKINSRNTRTSFEIYSKLTINTFYYYGKTTNEVNEN